MTPTLPTEPVSRPKKKIWRRMTTGMRSWMGRMIGAPVAAPELRLHRRFRSQFLEPERTLIVYVPPQYESHPHMRFTVLYMQDGQNLFDASTAFGGNEWRLDGTDADLIKHA